MDLNSGEGKRILGILKEEEITASTSTDEDYFTQIRSIDERCHAIWPSWQTSPQPPIPIRKVIRREPATPQISTSSLENGSPQANEKAHKPQPKDSLAEEVDSLANEAKELMERICAGYLPNEEEDTEVDTEIVSTPSATEVAPKPKTRSRRQLWSEIISKGKMLKSLRTEHKDLRSKLAQIKTQIEKSQRNVARLSKELKSSERVREIVDRNCLKKLDDDESIDSKSQK